jgi:hypothetical protein
MINEANRLIKSRPDLKIKRTKASPVDTITGILGEFVWAEHYRGNWRLNTVGYNKGRFDSGDIEVKCSARPITQNLNLLVREDYKEKRTPKYYVQLMIDIPRDSKEILAGSPCRIIGFAHGHEMENAPKKDFGNKNNEEAGYECYYKPFSELHPIEEINGKHKRLKDNLHHLDHKSNCIKLDLWTEDEEES